MRWARFAWKAVPSCVAGDAFAPEAVVSVVAIVGANATEAVGNAFTEAAGWLEYPEEWVAGSPGHSGSDRL